MFLRADEYNHHLQWSAVYNHWAEFLTETRLESQVSSQGATEPSLGITPPQATSTAQNIYYN